MSDPADTPPLHDVHAVIRSCSGKNRYDSEQSARRTAAKVYAQRRVWLRAYACTEGCGGYHLTHVDAKPPPIAANLRPPAKSMRQEARERNRRRDRRRRRR